ncbi:hypothetical protein ARMGADRAFT_1068631 [Armillaria gallica]|uniref:Uncharacterized protein n=1 Tax=Armillaria gallica TaxID=47427 RepID=A0A2H3CDX3_ARMGA|nr:hypothetical protein ARMGADRAFT_1068631 [Armillaria gallica]
MDDRRVADFSYLDVKLCIEFCPEATYRFPASKVTRSGHRREHLHAVKKLRMLKKVHGSCFHSSRNGANFWPETTYRVPRSRGMMARKGRMELIGEDRDWTDTHPNESCLPFLLEPAKHDLPSNPPTCATSSSLRNQSLSFPLAMALLLLTPFPQMYAQAMGSIFAPRRCIAFQQAGSQEAMEESSE